MKTRTLKVIGSGLIIAAVATGTGVQLAGNQLISVQAGDGHSPTGFMSSTSFIIDLHWSVLPLLAVAFAGLVCLVLPRRQQRQPDPAPSSK